MLKLKLQYFGHLMRRTDSFEKALIPGKIKGKYGIPWLISLDAFLLSSVQYSRSVVSNSL